MNDATKQFVASLRDDIARWEQTAAFLDDPHIAIEGLDGRVEDKAAMAARYRALGAEYRELLAKLTS